MAKMYIISDNGGRAVLLNAGELGAFWFICDCAPSGCFGYVDILDGTEQDAAARMRCAIDLGLLGTPEMYADVIDESLWRPIPEWHALDADEIEHIENAGRSCDFMTLTEI